MCHRGLDSVDLHNRLGCGRPGRQLLTVRMYRTGCAIAFFARQLIRAARIIEEIPNAQQLRGEGHKPVLVLIAISGLFDHSTEILQCEASLGKYVSCYTAVE